MTRKYVAGLATIVVFATAAAACSSEEGAPRGPETPEQRLARETQAPWVVDEDPATGTPDLMVALKPTAPVVVNADYVAAARKFLSDHKDMFKLGNVDAQLTADEVVLAGDGTAHVRFLQNEGGLLVEDAQLFVHFRADGSIAMVNGTVAPDAGRVNRQPTVPADQAVLAAENAIRTQSDPAYDRSLLTAPLAPVLVLRARGASAVLAWHFVLQTPTSGWDVLVDATTGAILERLTTFHDASGLGVKGDTKTFSATRKWLISGEYRMEQLPLPGFRSRVRTFDANQGNKLITSPDGTTWDRVSIGAGAAVDAHTYVAATDRWFRSNHGWASPDGRGSPIVVYAHDNSMVCNAWWDGASLHFSDGEEPTGGSILPLSAGADIVGHEYMHGVTQFTSGLRYQNDSGALDESLSDIFGTYVEASIEPSSVIHIGERANWILRDLAHPTTQGQPDHVSIREPVAERPSDDNDYGGVHGNSGIPNNAWYLMTMSGTNDTSQIPVTKSLGMSSSQGLWWATSRYLLGANATFDRTARWQTAWAWVTLRDVEAVGCAWVAVGVLESKYMKDKYDKRCYCELPDGGVQKPEEMQCCEPGTSDACCKQCPDAGAPADPDAGAPPPPPEETKPDFFDSCKGRADGVYCSQLASFSGIVCQNESIAYGVQCPNSARCLGPNGPGTQMICEGQEAPPPPPPGGNEQPKGDTCNGRPDGIYCSTVAPYSAYVCKDGSIAGGHVCPSGKTCAGPNGPGTTIDCR